MLGCASLGARLELAGIGLISALRNLAALRRTDGSLSSTLIILITGNIFFYLVEALYFRLTGTVGSAPCSLKWRSGFLQAAWRDDPSLPSLLEGRLPKAPILKMLRQLRRYRHFWTYLIQFCNLLEADEASGELLRILGIVRALHPIGSCLGVSLVSTFGLVVQQLPPCFPHLLHLRNHVRLSQIHGLRETLLGMS
jgi:hypothetical protein